MLPVSNDRDGSCKSYGQEPPVGSVQFSSSVVRASAHSVLSPLHEGGGEEIMKMALKGGNEIFK